MKKGLFKLEKMFAKIGRQTAEYRLKHSAWCLKTCYSTDIRYHYASFVGLKQGVNLKVVLTETLLNINRLLILMMPRIVW